MNHDRITKAHGSIYVLTLLTVAAVGSMILIGVSLRTTRNSQSAITEGISSNSSGVLDAAELALAKIATDNDWNASAQSGVVFTDFNLGDRSYTSAVVDANTLATATSSTTDYRVTISSTTGLAKESASLEVVVDAETYRDVLQGLGGIHYWPMTEAKNSTSAVNMIGTLNGTYRDPSIVGTSTDDEGGIVPLFLNNDDHAQFAHNNTISNIMEGTISTWLKLTSDDNFTVFGVTGKLSESGGVPAMSLVVISKSVVGYIEEDSVYDLKNQAGSGPGVLQLNTWHHVVMSWGVNKLRVYVDGSLVASNNETDGLYSYGGKWSSPLVIGAGYILSSGSQPITGFPGSIAHYAILNQQLTDQQVSELWAIKPSLERGTFTLVEDSWERFYE